MSRRLKILFTASVILNVLLAGALGGVAVVYNKPPPPSWQEVKDSLGPETRNLMARTFQKAYRKAREEGVDMKKIGKEAADAFAADPFDPERYEQAMRKMMEARSLIMEKKMEAAKELGAQLSVDERKLMADKFARPFDRHARSYEGRRSGMRVEGRPQYLLYGPDAPPPEVP